MEPDLAAGPSTLCEAFARTAAADPGAAALDDLTTGVSLTWGEYAERVGRIAAGLAALGVHRGSVVATMMTNRPEFNLVDTAALHLGAVPFSVYNTSSTEQIAFLLGSAAPAAVVAEAQFVGRLRDAGARRVVVVDAEGEAPDSLVALEAGADPGFDLAAQGASVTPDDLATLIYTSGTTGPPKGVELTHASVLAANRGMRSEFPVRAGDRVISYLPSAHIAERNVCHYTSLVGGVRLFCVGDPRKVGAALPEVRPDFFFAVPSVWQKLRARAESLGVADPAAVRAALGLDRARWACGGAAKLPPDTLAFFARLGLEVYELWGMSEVSGAVIANRPGHNRIGTVGLPQAGLEISVADDGELLARGPVLMRGYRGDEAATAAVVDADGWLHTGDVVTVDEGGYVTIVDRKKEIIINAGGKNMSPANIEAAVRAADPRAAAVVAIGDARPYVTALVVLDPDAAAVHAAAHGLPAADAATVAADPALRTSVAAAVAVANARLSRVEQVKRFRILPAFWAPGGEELTPTMKLRRRPIAARYASLIEELYAADPGPDILEPA